MTEPNVTAYGKVKQAGKDMGPAFLAAWPYMLLGILIGGAILYLHHELVRDENIWTQLWEHLGAGFFVSALAVFGYEWRAHIIKTMDTANKLFAGIGEIGKTRDTLMQVGHLLATIKRQEELRKESAEEGFKRCLEETLDLGRNDKLVYNCEKFVSHLSSLRRRNGWVDFHYLEFLSGILHDLVVKPSSVLVAVGEESDKETDEEQHLLITLDSAKVGDRLLAAHMQALEPGDEYWVVSDMDSWRGDRLARFRTATEAAITKNGVIVTRIFDLVRHRGDFRAEEMESALRTHLEDADKWKTPNGNPGYVVKVLGKAGYRKARLGDPNFSSENIKAIHFGLFKHGKNTVRVEVRRPDLSDLAISSSKDLIDNDTKTFIALDKAACTISLQDLKEKIQEVYDS